MDGLDLAILSELRRDGRLTNQELAQRIGLTPAPCLRRVRRLEEDGVITGYTVLVNQHALGKGLEVIIHAELAGKTLTLVEQFEQRLAAMDEVVELRRMFGLPDYLIRVRTTDLDTYERWVTTNLLGDPAIARIDSRLTMKLIKGHQI